MIAATELRIGNFILADGEIVKCSGVSWVQDDVNYQVFYSKEGVQEWTYDYEAIPLTEDWLRRFGLSQVVGGAIETWICKSPNVVIVKSFIYGYGFGGMNIDNAVKDPVAVFVFPIKSVHELQNLHFALTGEELVLDQEKQNA